MYINDQKVAIVVDLNIPGTRSVANDLGNIADKLDVKKIIYRDSMRRWDYYDIYVGFRVLDEYNQNEAIEKAIARGLLR